MFCLSKGHYYLDRIPRSSPFYKILFSSSAIWSWISSTSRHETTQIQVLLSKYSLSVEVLIALGSLNCSHSFAFPSHLSICSGGDHCDFFFPERVYLDLLRPHYSNCCFANLFTLSLGIQSTVLFQLYCSCLLSLDCHVFPSLHGFQHWACLVHQYFSTRNDNPPVSSRIRGRYIILQDSIQWHLFQEPLAGTFPVWFTYAFSWLI